MHPQTLLIGPNRVCDLGRIVSGSPFELMLYFTPNSFDREVRANQKIHVELTAVADNGESNPIRIEISWNGNWSDDTIEMSQNLVVRQL